MPAARSTSPDAALQTLLLEATDALVLTLLDVPQDRPRGIHEARKRIKRLRSALRLLRSWLVTELRAGMNTRLRDLARALAPDRDRAVMSDTWEALTARYPDQCRESAIVVRQLLAQRSTRTSKSEREKVLWRAARDLRAWRHELAATPVVGSTVTKLRRQLAATEKRAWERWATSLSDLDANAFHDARKRFKDWMYALDLLRPWLENAKELRNALSEFTEILGQFNDIDVLQHFLAEQDASLAQQAEVSDLLGFRKRQLLLEAEQAAEDVLMASKAFSPPRAKRVGKRVEKRK